MRYDAAQRKNKPVVVPSSGNVFADLGGPEPNGKTDQGSTCGRYQSDNSGSETITNGSRATPEAGSFSSRSLVRLRLLQTPTRDHQPPTRSGDREWIAKGCGR